MRPKAKANLITGVVALTTVFGAYTFYVEPFHATPKGQGPSTPAARRGPVSERLEAVRKGEPMTVTLDACTIDDSAWEPADDFLGTIQCGREYRVSYAAGTWTASGFNEAAGADVSDSNADTTEKNSAFMMWGVTFYLDGDDVLATDGTLVGHAR